MLGEARLALDAVLQREDRAARRETSSERLRRGIGVIRLDAKEDQVVGRELARIIRRGHWAMKIAARALEVEAVLLERLQISAARTEHHFLAGLMQPRAEVGANRTRAHY